MGDVSELGAAEAIYTDSIYLEYGLYEPVYKACVDTSDPKIVLPACDTYPYFSRTKFPSTNNFTTYGNGEG